MKGYGQSFFAGLEARLTRGLGLQGTLGPTPKIQEPQAVIVAADFSGLGYSDEMRGRQFFGRIGPFNGGAQPPNVVMRAQKDLLLEGVLFYSRDPVAPLTHVVRYYGRQNAMAVEPTGTFAGAMAFTERANSITEQPPITVSSINGTAMSGGLLLQSQVVDAAISAVTKSISYEWMLPFVICEGCGIGFSSGLASDADCYLQFRGRTL